MSSWLTHVASATVRERCWGAAVVASIWVESLLEDCSAESAVALTLRNKIVEVCCCNSKLLHFFDKSSIVWAVAIVALRGSCRREELLDADDHR